MFHAITTRTTGMLLALLLALTLAACEDDSSDGGSSLASEQSAGIGASGALGSALDNALEDTEDEHDGQSLSAGPGNRITAGAINRALGHVPGFRSALTDASGTHQLGGGPTHYVSEGPTTINVDFEGDFDCNDGGAVGVVGSASFTFEWDDGTDDLAFWHQSWEISALDMTLTDCAEDGYTLNGTAEYTTTQSGEFDQSAEDSPDYDFTLVFEEDSSADITATQESTGVDFDLDLSWELDATLTGSLNVVTEAAEFETVDAEGTWTANEWTCTATWTDPDGDWEASCSNN